MYYLTTNVTSWYTFIELDVRHTYHLHMYEYVVRYVQRPLITFYRKLCLMILEISAIMIVVANLLITTCWKIEICEQFERYDLSVADKIQVVYDNLDKIDNRIMENLSLLANEKKEVANRFLVQQKSVDRMGLEETLQNKEAELSSMRWSEKLLESCNEKDNKIVR